MQLHVGIAGELHRGLADALPKDDGFREGVASAAIGSPRTIGKQPAYTIAPTTASTSEIVCPTSWKTSASPRSTS